MLEDMLDDPENNRFAVWLRTAIDLPASLIKQNLIYAGGIMQSETPHYVKRNALISTALLLPFFIIVFARLTQNNHLNNSEAWRSSLWITILAMPIIALMLCSYSFGRWSRERKQPYLKSLADIRRNWMLIFVGLLAFLITVFVPFHDSTHCLAGNPVREARNFDQSWQCIWRG